MSAPFTVEQFLGVFVAYNAAIWPLQIIGYGLGVVAVATLWLHRSHSTKLILIILALMWAVNGIAYHFIFFSTINPAAKIFAVFFVLQAILFAAAAVKAADFHFKAGRDWRSVGGVFAIVYAMLIYPVMGIMAGHGMMAGPMFGVAPCPTTIFTIGMLMLARGRWVKWLSIIPLLWSLVGLAAALQLGIPEDFGLPVAGLLLLILIAYDAVQGRLKMRLAAGAPGAAAEAGTIGPLLDDRTRAKLAIFAFFVLAFAWSWSIGFVVMHVQARFPALSTALMMLSGFGPSLAGIAIVAALSTREEFRGWLARCLNWRIGWRWFAFAFALPPAVMLLALGIHRAIGGEMPVFTAADHIPLAIANFGLILLVGGPLGEEFGWRGYAMSALADKLGWRAASLIIGVVWGVWHLPLFFIASTAQAHMPIPLFMLNILAGSVVFGWLFERTKKSVLPALVLHTSLNAWAGILVIVPTPTTGGSYAVVTALLVLIALVLLLTADTKVSSEATPLAKVSRPC